MEVVEGLVLHPYQFYTILYKKILKIVIFYLHILAILQELRTYTHFLIFNQG
jgi:hypothetical protein